jgi:hypothetical protein
MCLFGDTRNSVMKKVTEFREIPRNFTELYDTEFSGIPRNFSQFRTEYGIDGSKKNRRNSVSTEFRGHPACGSPFSSRSPAACPFWLSTRVRTLLASEQSLLGIICIDLSTLVSQ